MGSRKGEEIDVVIVGGGICGLATALALHRKRIKSVVLERSDKLRATGAAIGVFANGWRALHQLGIDSVLRSTTFPIERMVNSWVDKGVQKEIPFSAMDACWVKRFDLIEALGSALPLGTIRFGCQAVSVHVEKSTSTTVLQLKDGGLINAKVLIGCDGANSVISKFIGLKPTQLFNSSTVRGLTIYPKGHGYDPEFRKVYKDKRSIGIVPINENILYWFIIMQASPKDDEVSKDPKSIHQMSLDITSNFPGGVVDVIRDCDLSSLSLTRLGYRAPWDLLSGSFRKGAVTVAGDAWHAMGPFLAQGGSAALEDAVMLARCLSKNMDYSGETGMILSDKKAKEALDEYLKERRPRVVSLSLHTYLAGLSSLGDVSFLWRLVCIVIMAVLFRDTMKHTRYDIGQL